MSKIVEALQRIAEHFSSDWPERCQANVLLARAALAEHDAQPAPQEPVAWVAVAERMPSSGVTVLVCYRNSADNWRRIRAVWIAAKSCESNSESEIGEYDEASDTYYDPEGWYEKIDNWEDYTAVAVYQGTVTHWMPLPAHPDAAIDAARSKT